MVLPPTQPEPAAVDELCQVHRYLLQETRRVERDLLESENVDQFFHNAINGFRSLLGCSHVEFWIHDPVNETKGFIHDWLHLSSFVHLTPDSSEIESLYGGAPEVAWYTEDFAQGLGLFKAEVEIEQACIIPLIDRGVLVGSINCANPRGGLLESESDQDLLTLLAAAMPLCLKRVASSQQASQLMLLDTVTHIANRTGMERDLAREISRGRRGGASVSMVALSLCGLESMNNMSGRHRVNAAFREVADKLDASLRNTDSLGRLSENCFGVLVADAPPERVPDIVLRMQRDVDGHLVDNGVGGVIEVNVRCGFVTWDCDESPAGNSTDMARAMIESAIGATRCTVAPGEAPVVRGELPSFDES